MPVKIIIITIAILVPFKKLNTCVKLLMAEFSTTAHKRQKCNSYRSAWMTFVHLSGNFSAGKLNLKRHTAAANGHYKQMKQHNGSVTKIQAERGRRVFYLHVCKRNSLQSELSSSLCALISQQSSREPQLLPHNHQHKQGEGVKTPVW